MRDKRNIFFFFLIHLFIQQTLPDASIGLGISNTQGMNPGSFSGQAPSSDGETGANA